MSICACTVLLSVLAAVIDAIASGTIDGITGTFTFDEHHDPVKQTAILTYVDGKPVLKEMF